jgi:predicted HicB family RNase H-like nuclease
MNKKKNPLAHQFNVRVTPTQLEELRRKAWDANESISTLVRDILEKNKVITSDGKK